MKIARVSIIIFLFSLYSLLFTPPVFAATYYVSTAGSDLNPGTSPQHSWKTVAKVNATLFAPGDSILFRRGDVWINEPLVVSSSGIRDHVITYGAYGTGALPKFDGNNLEHWRGLVLMESKSWITIENLELTNVGKELLHVLAQTTVSEGVTIRNNELHKNSTVGYMLIYVNAFNKVGNVNDITIENNHLYDGLHNSMRLTGGVTNAIIAGNTIHGFYHDGIDTYPGTVNNAYFKIYGNDIYNAKCGIYLPGTSFAEIYDNDIHDDWKGSPNPAYGAMSYGIKLDQWIRSGDHNTVRNNRIWNITSVDPNTYALWVSGSDRDAVWNNTVYGNYNTFLVETNTNLSNANNLAYANTRDMPALRNYGADPKFINPAVNPPDFRLQPGSPMIDKGIDVGLPYMGMAPDVGAYEYLSPLSSPTTIHSPTPGSSTVAGDLNGDSHVDIFDYNILVQNFGRTGSPGFTPADIDRSGTVDIFDYNILVGNFGK